MEKNPNQNKTKTHTDKVTARGKRRTDQVYTKTKPQDMHIVKLMRKPLHAQTHDIGEGKGREEGLFSDKTSGRIGSPLHSFADLNRKSAACPSFSQI